MQAPKDITSTPEGIIDTLRAEWTKMRIMGRGSTPKETRQSGQISDALPPRREALGLQAWQGVEKPHASGSGMMAALVSMAWWKNPTPFDPGGQ